MERAAKINHEAWFAVGKAIRCEIKESSPGNVFRQTVRRLDRVPISVSTNREPRRYLAITESWHRCPGHLPSIVLPRRCARLRLPGMPSSTRNCPGERV